MLAHGAAFRALVISTCTYRPVSEVCPALSKTEGGTVQADQSEGMETGWCTVRVSLGCAHPLLGVSPPAVLSVMLHMDGDGSDTVNCSSLVSERQVPQHGCEWSSRARNQLGRFSQHGSSTTYSTKTSWGSTTETTTALREPPKKQGRRRKVLLWGTWHYR